MLMKKYSSKYCKKYSKNTQGKNYSSWSHGNTVRILQNIKYRPLSHDNTAESRVANTVECFDAMSTTVVDGNMVKNAMKNTVKNTVRNVLIHFHYLVDGINGQKYGQEYGRNWVSWDIEE